MVTCPECGGHVSDTFVRVMLPDGAKLTGCPNCPDNSQQEYDYEIVE